jgi:hypothetical protein
MGSKMIKKVPKSGLKKTDGSWFFGSNFDDFCSKSVLYGFIEKQAPQKALCLGPDPPPGENMKFIEKMGFFMILGPSIEPEKASVKSASTPYPPWKVIFIRFLINSRPNFVPLPLFDHYSISPHTILIKNLIL